MKRILLAIVFCISIGYSNAQVNTDLKDWSYKTEVDEMTDNANIFATLKSANIVDLSFPYEDSIAEIAIRCLDKKWDALIIVSDGQIHGNDYIRVRFDNDQPITYTFIKASSGSSKVVFIRNKMDFIKHCKEATSIRIEVPFYRDGNRIFKFETDIPLTLEIPN